MHLAGAGKVDLVNYSTCLHRLTRVMASPTHPSDREKDNCKRGGPERSREGTGHCWTCDLRCWCATAEMACGMDPGTSVLEGSNVMANRANIGGTVGGGGGNKAGEAEDVLGAVAGGGDGRGSVACPLGGQQLRSPKPLPPPLPVPRASLPRDAMVRLLLSSSPLLVGVLKLILTSLNFLVLVLP
jgi:hypothetical protein